MTRGEAIERLDELASRLEADVRLCQTRDQHLRCAQRLAEVRALRADLAPAVAPRA